MDDRIFSVKQEMVIKIDALDNMATQSHDKGLFQFPRKRVMMPIDERLALELAMNVKAMDALKLSGQEQQIKLTLKGSGAGAAASAAIITGKKRPAESPPMDFSPPKLGGKATPKKTAPSRREELLKQLKAVEDAIARKRSKIS